MRRTRLAQQLHGVKSDLPAPPAKQQGRQQDQRAYQPPARISFM